MFVLYFSVCQCKFGNCLPDPKHNVLARCFCFKGYTGRNCETGMLTNYYLNKDTFLFIELKSFSNGHFSTFIFDNSDHRMQFYIYHVTSEVITLPVK